MNRSLKFSLIVAFLLLTASESRSQDGGAACCRADTLIDRFQQRFFAPLVECGCNTKVSEDEFPDEKTSGQKAAPIQKAPMIQKSASCAPKGVAVQKHSAAQRSSCAQRTDCGTKAVCGQTGVFSWTGSGLPHGCEPCGYCRRNLGSGVLDRLPDVRGWLLPTSFCRSSAKDAKGGGKAAGPSHAQKACTCGAAPPELDSESATPMLEKPRIEANPFQDDALQPAPLPSEPSREARLLPRKPARGTAIVQEVPAPIRTASHFFEPVETAE